MEVSQTPETPRTNGRSHEATASPRLTSAPSPLRETPRKQREKRPYASKAWGTPQPGGPTPRADRRAPRAGSPWSSAAAVIATRAFRG